MMRLRHIAHVRNSNVDKVENPEETPIRLCNYVDVYKNDFITNDLPFMAGTATRKEIDAFRLRAGDVIITKDSEDRTDIGVPALVRSTAEDLVCGYHLTMLRPDRRDVLGEYLFWALQTHVARDAFSNAAYGVTRYGLSVGAMKSIGIPVPDLDSQKTIADFLDRETARIDALVEKKRALSNLLEEKLRAKITEMTAPHDGYTANGMRLRHTVDVAPRVAKKPPAGTEVTFVPMEALAEGTGGMDTSRVKLFEDVDSGSYNYFEDGDVLLAKVTPCFENGKKALARSLSNGMGFATSEVHVLRPRPGKIEPRFLIYLLSSESFKAEGVSSMTGAGGLRRVSDQAILNHRLKITDLHTQIAIADFLDGHAGATRLLREKIEHSVLLLKEARASLITASVCGQIDPATYRRQGNADRTLDQVAAEIAQ